MKKTGFILLLLISGSFLYSQVATRNDPQAYIVYKQGNEMYKVKKYDDAKNYYLQLINEYPDSKFVPYSIYMLSFMETDYIKIIDYLSLIKDKYPEFRYWTNSVEKLADIFYVMGNHVAAIDQYKMINTDKAYYMLSLIYSANGYQDLALSNVNKLLIQTKDNSLAYKGFIIESKIYLDTKKYTEVYPILQQALKLRKWAFDNGSRILFYAGKYYFYRNEIENHFEKSLYIFSLLKTKFPLSVEASLVNPYIDYFNKNNIVKIDYVRWINDEFAAPAEVPYQNQTVSVLDELENKAEKVSSAAEGAEGNMIKAGILEYAVRIGEYKDLSVANLVAKDIVRSGYNFPLGIYYRNDMYYAEIRGINKVDEAKDIAKKMIAMGYTDTKVIEFTKVVEYNK